MREDEEQGKGPLSYHYEQYDKSRRRHHGYRRALGLTVLGTIIPGSGLVIAGRRRIGWAILVLAALVAGFLGYLLLLHRDTVLHWAVQPGALVVIGTVLPALALAWVCVIIATYRSLLPRGVATFQRIMGYGLVAVLALVTVVPLGVGGRYALVQKDVVQNVFAGSHSRSATAPKHVSVKNPWAGKPRVNIALLGGDGGPDRVGVRTDTVIIASIDTRTGNTVLFSLPRNLEKIPFPKGSVLADAYPNGIFDGKGNRLEWMLTAVYRNVPEQFPGLLKSDNPGADAVKLAAGGATGLNIDYYVLVNLEGFRELVDALGGITVNVNSKIPMGGESSAGLKPGGWILPGPNKHLDGFHALWFARARYGADDYARMRRQRCTVKAIVDQADPVKLLTRYEALARTAKDIVLTDIPQSLLPAVVDLSLKVKKADVTNVAFTNELIRSAHPDYDFIHNRVKEALRESENGTAVKQAADDLDTACAYKGRKKP
ncbi:LCP family protein [Actinopolymorpha singaporensis]|uniref:Cell envelope-related function transcriptional attenuator common domain-containing protein n=1 Tax=Actinopolymorpha singaporensis TaxID=117157 RepID=A0A1H1PPB2_9ACTN|nr:LCP family protein [Actinopolymorpha singaporensis]SDS12935.1 cell envelope-related function transcriptional attenuator common domain-containing protein [Actinopolymorpha singaporensis]